MTIRKPFFVVLGILIVLILAAYFSPQQTAFVLFRVIFLVAALLFFGFVWALTALDGIEFTRTARGLRQQVGQLFEERIELHNRSPVGRLWVEVRDLSALPAKPGPRVVSSIGPRQQRSYVTRISLIKRGAFLLGPNMLVSGDPFGLFVRKKIVSSARNLIVLPFTVDLDYFPEPTGKLPGGQTRRLKTLEVTPYAAGVREYAPGDPLNRIHWRSTARKDRLIVKEFEQDPQADVLILLDAQNSLHLSRPTLEVQPMTDLFWLKKQREIRLPEDTFDYCVSSAASIAKYYLNNGRAVGLLCAAQSLSMLPFERGERQLTKILEMLAFLQPEGELSLLGLIESRLNLIPRGSTIVVITPSGSEDILIIQDILLRRDLRPLFVFIDPKGFGAEYSVQDVVEKLRIGGPFIKTVRNGDDLKLALERVN